MRNDEDAIHTGAVITTSCRQGVRPGCKRTRRGHQNHKSINSGASASCLILISMLLGWTSSSSSSRTAMRGVFVSGFASVRTRYSQSRSQVNAQHVLSNILLREDSSIHAKVLVRNYHGTCVYNTASASAQDTPTFAADFLPATDSAATATTIETCYDRLFDMRLPEGRCVGLELHELAEDDPNGLTPQAIMDPDHTNTNTSSRHLLHSFLHPEEVAYGMGRSCFNARESFFLGRLAMRQALGFGPHHLQTTDAILKDEYGRPMVPPGFLGSISHKRGTGVALVAVDDSVSTADSNTAGSTPRLGIGIDLEQICSQGKSSIARKVLTKREIEDLGRIEGLSSDEEVLLRFSIKESIYKAMHPLICQYVGFQEAEVQPQADGSVLVRLDLKSGAHKRFGKVTAHWRKLPDLDFFLTSASVRLKDDDDEDEDEKGPHDETNLSLTYTNLVKYQAVE